MEKVTKVIKQYPCTLLISVIIAVFLAAVVLYCYPFIDWAMFVVMCVFVISFGPCLTFFAEYTENYQSKNHGSWH